MLERGIRGLAIGVRSADRLHLPRNVYIAYPPRPVLRSSGVIFHSIFSQPSLHLISFAPPAVSLVRTPRHRPPWQAKSLLPGLLVSPSPLCVRLPSLR